MNTTENKKQPLVSVIITTYHNEAYLSRAVKSVLHQTYPAVELIVVDDNQPGTDERRATEAVMEKYPRAVYLKHPENRNGAAARNTGIRAAKGKYIAFLDNDDIYFSTHIACCVRELEDHPDCGAVLCGVVKIRGGCCWDVITPPEGELVRALLLSETALGTGSNLFARADLVRSVQGFDESFRRHQDVEFGVRIFSLCDARRVRKIQIVKEMDGFSNRPDFERFRATKEHFISKFQRELGALGPEERNTFYAGQWSSLLYAACGEENVQGIRTAVSEIGKYRKVSGKERLLVILCKFHIFFIYEGMKRFLKRRKSGKIYSQVTENLSEYDRKIFLDMLKG